jgi:hypothetical protein
MNFSTQYASSPATTLKEIQRTAEDVADLAKTMLVHTRAAEAAQRQSQAYLGSMHQARVQPDCLVAIPPPPLKDLIQRVLHLRIRILFKVLVVHLH